MQKSIPDQIENIYTVSRLNNEVRYILEESFPFVWVEGEISNFAAPHSGHWYFSLKDPAAQVRCAMFRGNQRKLQFAPKDGMHVLIKARVSLYENRGEFQLIAEDMEERGEGKLRRAFEVLKKKLEAAGLFDVAHKKPLPPFPKQIGVITSATGAAIRDILTVLRRRFPCLSIIIYPTLVQGETAAPAIVNAIQIANKRNECDVLILARGGGSLEDLWPFNEEIVAQAIHQSRLPIISGVGHEVDFTIADFVADKRAATPSAAAEIASPHKKELLKMLLTNQQYVIQRIKNKLLGSSQQVIWIKKHLVQQHPKKRLLEKMQRLDYTELNLVQLQTRMLNKRQTEVKNLNFRLHRQFPIESIHKLINQAHLLQQKLKNVLIKNLNKHQTKLAGVAAKLDTLSPLATLNRGYAIALKNNHILNNAQKLKPGDALHVRLAKGSLDCLVEKVNLDDQ